MAKSESMAKSCSNKCIHSGICFDKGVVNALTKWIAAMLGMLHSQLLEWALNTKCGSIL